MPKEFYEEMAGPSSPRNIIECPHADKLAADRLAGKTSGVTALERNALLQSGALPKGSNGALLNPEERRLQ